MCSKRIFFTRFAKFTLVAFIATLPTCKQRPAESELRQETTVGANDKWGVWFNCPNPDAANLAAQKTSEFLSKNLGWSVSTNQGQNSQVGIRYEKQGSKVDPREATEVGFFLNDPDPNTLDIKRRRPDLKINDAKMQYHKRIFNPDAGPKGALVTDSKLTSINISSTKEIVASLLNAGRITTFANEACAFEQLIDHVALRMNVVIWTMKSHLYFPTDSYNNQYDRNKFFYDEKDDEFTIAPGIDETEALTDPLYGNIRYTFGCAKSCKYLQIGSIAEYFKKVKTSNLVTNVIRSNNKKPLSDGVKGALLQQIGGISPANWVPGDWGYIKNTDPFTHEYVSGTEGCNVIFVGNGGFGRYYENHEPRSFKNAICRVYNWRWSEVVEAVGNLARWKDEDKNFVQQFERSPQDSEKDWCYPDDTHLEKSISDERMNQLVNELLSTERTFPSTSLLSDDRANDRLACLKSTANFCEKAGVIDNISD